MRITAMQLRPRFLTTRTRQYAEGGSGLPLNGTSVTTVNLIDALVYDTDDADDAGLLVLLNFSQPQVNEDGGGSGVSAVNSMQRCTNGSGGQRNTGSYVLDAPTPGLGNACGNCIDMDGDGYGQPANADCVISSAADCDDADRTINPGRVEICDNNVDDDCDGLMNEDDLGDCVLLYVELESFTAEWDGSRVVVRWKTVVEKENAGFRVLRQDPGLRKGAEVIHVGHIYPKGSESYGAEYEVVDYEKFGAGTLHYYLEDIDLNGQVTRHGPVEVQIPGRSRQLAPGRRR